MSAPSSSAITAATRAWRHALGLVPDQAAFLAGVEQSQRDADLLHQGKPVLTVAEPVFLTESQKAGDQACVGAVLAALVAAGEQVLADPALRSRFTPELTPDSPTLELMGLPSGYPAPIVFGRLDGMRVGDDLTFLEFNGGLPGGVTPADVSSRLMSSWPVARTFAAEFDFSTMIAAPALMSTLVDTWRSFGGSGQPFIVLALPDELTEIAAATVNYLATAAAAAELDIAVADPGKLSHVDSRLRLAGRPVDVLVRGFFTTMVDYLGSRLDAIISAVRAGDLCMVTSMRSGLYGYKTLFAAITDPDFDLDLPTEVLATARRHLPWTRLVEPGTTTTPYGDTTDLGAYVAEHRQHLVLKPGSGFGGTDVELGWQHTDQSWAAALSRALATGGFVVQQAIESPRHDFTTLAPGLPIVDFATDHNPIITGSQIAGYYVRVTPGRGVTNVTAGAGIAPTFVIPDSPTSTA